MQGIAFQVEQDCYEASGGQAMIEEPRDLKEALKFPDADKWQEAADEEMKALIKRGTFEFTIPPGNAHIISSKFVFRLKKCADGTIDKYKARLVARGFTQVEGVDFYMDDTEAPVARLTTVRALLAHAAAHGWPVRQIDVKSAYLYGKL